MRIFEAHAERSRARNRPVFPILAAALVRLGTAPVKVVWNPDLIHSRAEFTVSHMVLSKVWGHVPIRALTLETAPGSVLPEHIDAVLDEMHEDTDNHDRDADLRSETYFDVAHYPTMTFHSTKTTRADRTTRTSRAKSRLKTSRRPSRSRFTSWAAFRMKREPASASPGSCTSIAATSTSSIAG